MTMGFLDLFLLFLVTNGPFKALVVFGDMTARLPLEERIRIATKATITATIIMLVFSFFGGIILGFFHVTLPALMIAGGIILLVFSLGMVTGSAQHGGDNHSDTDISIYPIAIPLLATPQGIVAIVALMSASQNLSEQSLVLIALLVVLALNFVLMRYAHQVLKLLKPEILLIVGRIIAVLLAALAIQMMIFGLVRLGVLDKSVLPH
jgi:multiple antibiotic resistance protein